MSNYLSRFIRQQWRTYQSTSAGASNDGLKSDDWQTSARSNCNSLTTCASNAAGQHHQATRSTCIT